MFAEIIKKQPIPGLETLQENYEKDPSNKTLKALTLASAPYLFTEKGQTSGIKLLSSLPYNHEAYQWSDKHFDSTYQAKWVPQKIPALIMAGKEDLVTPLQLFKKEKTFCRDNIKFRSIKNAGHFPWIENPSAVVKEFKAYAKQLEKK
ncbi:MAG TPA: alpha/beta hydrolase [Rhabdochlamydiaceae bacterium]|nr:alpha/beta hydrolase [Rhabdochlamydiaceae bacterium]